MMLGCAIMGVVCSIAIPEEYEVQPEIIEEATQMAENSGATIGQINDTVAAIKLADIVYTDVWTSMRCENEVDARLQAFSKYQVNREIIQHAKSDYLFMHCLPAIRGQEVTAAIIDSPNSVVFDQAENRLHAQKAVLASVM